MSALESIYRYSFFLLIGSSVHNLPLANGETVAPEALRDGRINKSPRASHRAMGTRKVSCRHSILVERTGV